MPNGDTQTVVPGQTQGTTPPFLPQQGGGGVDEQTKKILQMLVQSASQKRFAGQPRPSPVPGKQDPFSPPSYMTSGPNPHAWGAQRLMYGIQSMMKNAVGHHKEEQITKATADWEYAQSALNEYYAAQESKNPEALAAAQKKLDVVFGDPKKLKNMAKALNQDWLNPEKTTPYGEALKRVAGETQKKDSQKQQAKQGIMGIFKKLVGKGQPQAQMNPDETKRMEQEVISKAPTTSGASPETAKMIVPFVTAEERVQAQKDIQAMKDQAQKEIEEMKEKSKKELQKPVDKVLSEAQEAFGKGDMETYQTKLKEAGQMSSATKPPSSSNQFELIRKANAGDPESAKTLQTYWQKQIELAKARGAAIGEGRAQWQIGAYVDENGQLVPMSNFDAVNALHEGKTLTPAGRLSPNTVLAAQRLVSEATPAIEQMYKATITDPKTGKSLEVEPLKAFDNESDKAIFARLLSSNPGAIHGQEFSWLGNIMNQALTGKLSPEGKAFANNTARLADTLGVLRATLGLPATETMTALAMNLIPGVATPDSSFAKDKMNLLEQMVTNAVQIPALKGVTGKGAKGFSVSVGGKTFQFKDQKSLDAFKKEAGIQ
jgi:hypothetical protein